MNSKAKIILYSLISLIGLLLYLSTYFIVPFTLEYTILKYIVMIVGYLSVIVFPIGFYNLIKEIRKYKSEKQSNQ